MALFTKYTSEGAAPAFNIIAKPTGAICNLDCTYCYYLDKEQLYPNHSNFKMSDDVLETFIRQKIQNHRTAQVHFVWQGGEPTLLGVDFFKRVVELQHKYADGKTIQNGFQTNGVLLDDEWCQFFKEQQFLVGLSIDGPEEIHDRYRVNKGGSGTFRQVKRGLRYLQKHDVPFNTLTVVQRHNSYHPLAVYRFLKEIGSTFMQFIPVVERKQSPKAGSDNRFDAWSDTSDSLVTEWSVEASAFGQFLCVLFDEWVRNDVGRYFVQIFDLALQAWMGMEPNLCIFRKTCGDALAMEHNGDLYTCDHFVSPSYKLGNIMVQPMESLIGSDKQRQFGRDKEETLPRYCRQCEVRFVCNGECPKNRFIRTPDGEAGLNYLCAGYKQFFNHIDPYMHFMARELKARRPPANVMQWAKTRTHSNPL